MSESNNRPLLIIGGLLAAVVVIGGGIFFGARRFLQTSQATATAMPPDTALYASFDTVSLLEPGSLRTLGRLGSLSGEEVADNEDDLYDQFDEQLASYGLTFEEDIQPWLGRSVGAGVLSLDADTSEPERFVVAIEIRDRGEADAFLDKVAENNDTESNDYNDFTYLSLTSKEGEDILIGRSDSLMLMGSDDSAMEDAVDALDGESLVDVPGFEAVVAKLPETRAFTLVGTSELVGGLQQLIEQEDTTGAMSGMFDSNYISALQMMAGSLRFTENGIEIDVATQYDLDALSEDERAVVAEPKLPSGDMLAVAPDNTLVYFNSAGLGQVWETQKEIIEETNEDFADSLQLVEEQLGFSINDDLMPQLTGEMGVFLFEATSGLLPDFAELDLGFALAHGVEDSAEMQDLVDQLTDVLVENGVEVSGEDGLQALSFFGTPVGVLGMQDDRFVISSSVDDAAQLGATQLSDNARFSQAQDAFPNDMQLVMWVDLAELLATLDADAEIIEQVEAFPMFAAAGSADATRLIVFVEDTE